MGFANVIEDRKTRSSRARSVAALTLAYAGSAIAQRGLGFALFLWFAHRLPVADYARFGLLYAIQSGVAMLAMAGIVETAIGGLKGARTPESRKALLASAHFVFIVKAGLSILIAAVALSWSELVDARGLALAAISGALLAYFLIQSQLSRIVEQHRVALIVGFVPVLFGFLGGLIGFGALHSSLGFFLGWTAALTLSLPIARATRINLPSKARNNAEINYIAHHLGPYLLVAIVDWFCGYGNTFLVKIFFSVESVARFVFAYTLSSAMYLIATSLNQAWAPRVFRILQDTPQEIVEEQNRRFYLFQGILMGATGGGIVLLLPLAMRFAGSGFVPYIGTEFHAAVLFAAYIMAIPWYHVQNYYYVYARGAVLMRISAGTSVVGLLIWVGAAFSLGEWGPYFGFVAMMVVKMAGGVFWARREWGVRLLWQGPIAGLGLLALGSIFRLALV